MECLNELAYAASEKTFFSDSFLSKIFFTSMTEQFLVLKGSNNIGLLSGRTNHVSLGCLISRKPR